MDASSPRPIYAVDTSSFIELQRRFRRRTFGRLWTHLDGLADNGRLVVPEQVHRELGDDITQDPVRWLRDHSGIVHPTAHLWDRAKEVANRFTDFVDLAKPDGSADPYLIALALEERDRQRSTLWESPVILVTEENRKRPGRVAIPDACDEYGLTVVKLQGLFDSEGWEDL